MLPAIINTLNYLFLFIPKVVSFDRGYEMISKETKRVMAFIILIFLILLVPILIFSLFMSFPIILFYVVQLFKTKSIKSLFNVLISICFFIIAFYIVYLLVRWWRY